MSKLLRGVPVEKQIARHMHLWEMQSARWRDLPKHVVQKLGPYISVSRELGSGGEELSLRVAEKLGWQHFDREILEAIASRAHARQELVSKFDEHHPSSLDTYLHNLFTGQRFDNTQYLYHLSQVLLGIAQFGRTVILGRGANFILPPTAGLRVRVIAPLTIRQQRYRQENECHLEQAAKAIAAHDQEQKHFIRHHFRRDIADPLAYDILINTGEVKIESAVDLILQQAEAKLK